MNLSEYKMCVNYEIEVSELVDNIQGECDDSVIITIIEELIDGLDNWEDLEHVYKHVREYHKEFLTETHCHTNVAQQEFTDIVNKLRTLVEPLMKG